MINLTPWFVAFAPFDLKNANVYVQDGFGETVAGGSDETPKVKTAALADDTSIAIEQLNVAAYPGHRFTVTGSTETHEITAVTIASSDVNEVQNLALDTPSAGTFTLSFMGATTDPIAFNASAATIDTALEALSTIGAGNVAVTAGSDFVFTFGGDLAALSLPLVTIDGSGLTGAGAEAVTRTTQGTKDDFTTTMVTFTPGLTGNVSALAAITILPVRLEIKMGDGNVEFDEARELEYFLDRGRLDTVREADETPMEVSFSATWEFIKSLAGATTPTFKEAVKGTGPASNWYSSADDPCEPYAVDIVIVQAPDAECSSTLGVETITLEDFRHTNFGHSAEDGEISVEGSCNRTEALVERVLV